MRELIIKSYVITADMNGDVAIWNTKDLNAVHLNKEEGRWDTNLNLGDMIADNSNRNCPSVASILGIDSIIQPGTKAIIDIKQIVETTFTVTP